MKKIEDESGSKILIRVQLNEKKKKETVLCEMREFISEQREPRN